MRSINRHVSLLFRMGERFLNRRYRGIPKIGQSAVFELFVAGLQNPVSLRSRLRHADGVC